MNELLPVRVALTAGDILESGKIWEGQELLEELQKKTNLWRCGLTWYGERSFQGLGVAVNTAYYPTLKLGLSLIWTDKPTGYGSSSRRAPQTGIVDECCFRSCDLRRLEMYCAPLKPTKSARSVRAQRHTDMPKAQKVSPPGAAVRVGHLREIWVMRLKQLSSSSIRIVINTLIDFWLIVSKELHSPLRGSSFLSLHLINSPFYCCGPSDHQKMVGKSD